MCRGLGVEPTLELGGRSLDPVRARERHGRPVEAVEGELRTQCGERVERDPAVRRELAARNREHPRGSDREDRLAARAGRAAVAAGQDAKAGERRAYELRPDDLGLERDGGLSEDLVDVLQRRLDPVRRAFVQRVGRAEEQHAEPGDRERHARFVLRDRDRRRPRLVEREQRVHALAQPHRRADGCFLQPADGVDPRARRVHDRAGLDGDRLVVRDELGPDRTAAGDSQLAHLGVVEDGGACVRGRPNVREAEPAVVRLRVRVEPGRAEAVEPQRGDELACRRR